MKQDADTDDNLLPVQQEAVNPLDVRLYEIDYVMSYPLGQGLKSQIYTTLYVLSLM